MTILVSHQGVPPHFTTKLRPCLWPFQPRTQKQYLWPLLTSPWSSGVAIGNLERHVRKALHRGSEQQ